MWVRATTANARAEHIIVGGWEYTMVDDAPWDKPSVESSNKEKS